MRYKVGAEQLQQVPSLVHRPDTVFQAARTAPVGPTHASAPPPARSPAGSRRIGSGCWTKTGRPTALARSAPAASPQSALSARRHGTSASGRLSALAQSPSSSTGVPTGQRVPSEVDEECRRRPVMAAPVHVRSRSGWLVSAGTSIQQPAGDGGAGGGGRTQQAGRHARDPGNRVRQVVHPGTRDQRRDQERGPVADRDGGRKQAAGVPVGGG